jgi:hypothetical protein
VVVASAVVNELLEHLLVWERELESREGAVAAQEDGLATSDGTLGMMCMERDAERAWAKAVRQDYLARTCAFTASY